MSLDVSFGAITKLFILLNIKNISKQDPDPDPKKMDRICNTGIHTFKAIDADFVHNRLDKYNNKKFLLHLGL